MSPRRPMPDRLAEERRRARRALATDATRAGARSHFRAMGIDPARLAGPIVGIASTWTGTMPCNLNQRELAAHVAEADDPAGRAGVGFHTIPGSEHPTTDTP